MEADSDQEVPQIVPSIVRTGNVLHDGRYKLTEQLAEGRFSTLWAARDNKAPCEVALKVNELADLPSFTAASIELDLLRHAAGTGGLDLVPPSLRPQSATHTPATSHPGAAHVCALLGAFEHRSAEGRHLVAVLPRLGDSLAQVLHAAGGGRCVGLPLPAVRALTQQMLLALDYLHRERCMVHLNVRPEHLVLTQQFDSALQFRPLEALRDRLADAWRVMTGQQPLGPQLHWAPGCVSEVSLHSSHAVLADFGRALRLDVEPPPPVGQRDERIVVFTNPAWRSPEEVLALEYRTPACDMWQAGLTVYALATGQDLFAPQVRGAGQGVPPPPPGTTPEGDWDLDDWHLAELVGVLGRPPFELVAASPLVRRFFRPNGRLLMERHVSIAKEPLDLILREDHGFDPQEAEELAEFLDSLLQFDPSRRASAAQALRHPWLSGDQREVEGAGHSLQAAANGSAPGSSLAAPTLPAVGPLGGRAIGTRGT